MISSNHESPAPEIRPPMPNGENEADELAFVGGEGLVPRRNGAAEEGHGMGALHQNSPETVRRRVALHDERLAKVGQCQDRSRRNGELQSGESSLSLLGPGEPLFFEQSSQGRSNGPGILNEFAVVPRQSEEATHCTHRTWRRLVRDGLHLSRVHGDACRRDSVAKIGDGGDAERTLRLLDKELMLLQSLENKAHMPEMVDP